MLKYRYALGANGQTYDVLALGDETRRIGAPYTCLGCCGELIPNLPRTGRTKYFSHKVQQNCSRETYLHRLAKSVFRESYTEALVLGQPFWFSYRRGFSCTAYESTLAHVCEGEEVGEFDLTTTHKRIVVEKAIGDFIPDVTLLSDKHQAIFVEMLVTHESSKKKVTSGAKVIEISITNEDDIELFRHKRISETSRNVRTYGIRGKRRIDDQCKGDCVRRVEFFVLSRDGKARMETNSPTALFEKLATCLMVAPAVKPESSDADPYQRFVANLRHHYFRGVPIRNCLLCKHQRIGQHSGIWCEPKAVKITSASAVSCNRYAPFNSLVEARQGEKRNLVAHIARGKKLVEQMLRDYR